MKKYFALCLCAVLLICASSAINLRAQAAGGGGAAGPMVTEGDFLAAESKLNMVSLDALRFLGFFNLSYTRAITPAISLTAQLETPSNFVLGSIIRESGFGARVEGRYNFAQKNLVGIFAGPVIGFNSSTFSPGSAFTGTPAEEFSVTVNWLALGAMIGYQFAPFGGLPELMLGFGLGAEYNIINTTVNDPGNNAGSVVPEGNTVYPRVRFTIGYAF